MFFENALYRGSQFLDIYDNNDNLVTPTYTKEESWLTIIGISNSIYAYAICFITNYTSIDKYKARFYPNKNTSCLYSGTQLKMCHYILYQCSLYKGYNYMEYILSKTIDFLQSNHKLFVSWTVLIKKP